MSDDKLKEEERIELVEKPDPGHDDAHAKITIDDDAALLAGKVSFAQKVVGDRFEVLDIIGQGGMGSVYKVRDLNTDRIVALKLLKPELCEDKAVLKRFLQEAASLSELDHENIVTVYDHGITGDGAPFLLMQYLDGETLADLIARNGKLSPAQAIDLTLQICNGLYYAHMKGFIHRDIKPSNIVLLDDGATLQVKLLDFGIAKIIETKSAATTNLTQTGDVFGTPAYMSPEQCQGGDIDSRTDIYSLGCVLYKMLTGKQPFAGSNAIQVALKHINGTPDSFTRKLPDGDVLHSLEELVFKCMKKDPAERFSSIAEVSTDLRSVKGGAAVAYEDPEEEAKNLKAVPTPLLKIGRQLWNVLFYWTVFINYTLSIALICFSDPMDFSYSRTGACAALIGTCVVGLATHARAAVRAVQNRRKRKTLFQWVMALLAVLMFSTYGLFGLVAVVPQSELSGNILSVAVVIWTIITWALIASSILIGFLEKVRNSVARLIFWWKRKSDPTLVWTKSTRSPMSFSKASSRVVAILALVIIGFTTTNLPALSLALSSGVFNLIAATGSNLAVPVLKASIALDPRNVHAYKALAYQFDHSGEPEMRLETLNRGLEVAPGDTELLVDRGETYLADEEYSKAAVDFEKKANQNIDARIGLGKAYLGLGEFEKSYRTFTAAINQSGSSEGSLSEAYTGRALASYARGSYEAAIDDLSKSIEENDGSNKSLDYVRRGLAYQAIGQRTAARHDFEKAYRGYISDADGETALVRAFCLIQIGNKPAAEMAMSYAMKENMTKDDLAGIVFPNLPSVKFKW